MWQTQTRAPPRPQSPCDKRISRRRRGWEARRRWADRRRLRRHKGKLGVNNFTKYTVSEFGQVPGCPGAQCAAAMAAEISARGPIACSIAVTEALEAYRGGIFKDTTGVTAHMHTISVSSIEPRS